jgi:hypothetical protein
VPVDRRERGLPVADGSAGVLLGEEIEHRRRRRRGTRKSAVGFDLGPGGVGSTGRGDEGLLAAGQEALRLAFRLLQQELVLLGVGLLPEEKDHQDAEDD